jgi:hypothetical protein
MEAHLVSTILQASISSLRAAYFVLMAINSMWQPLALISVSYSLECETHYYYETPYSHARRYTDAVSIKFYLHKHQAKKQVRKSACMLRIMLETYEINISEWLHPY